MKEILKKLLAANTTKEVVTILETLTDNYDVKWRPVGDRENNQSTINIGSDPASGLVERITNSIDSVLDLEWYKQGCPKDITSPRSASQKWFNIADGKLRTIVDFGKNIEELARKTIVTLKDSEKDDAPTVEIRDMGLGISGKDFEKTILSLNFNNKIDKLHQLGAYGQGGSTALSFSNFTIIISKPHEILKKGSDVSFTIVRFNNGDVSGRKFGWYEYIVGKDNLPFSITVKSDEFEHGTLVRHIGMDIGKYTAKLTGPTSSLWYLAHHYMFDTVLPFTIRGERKKDLNKEKVETRSVLGNNRRLTLGGGKDENNLTQYKREATLTFKDGKITIYYWVLTLEGDKPQERIKNYTLPSEPIIITFNGQRQGALTNSIIKSELKLPFLEKYIIVQIECDNLDNESKRQLFSSTRESTRDTSIRKDLEQLLVETLDADDELKRLDRERRERYLKKDENEVLDKLRKRLASRINAYIKTGGGGSEVKATETKEIVKTKKQPPIPINDPPTFIEITSPENKEVYIGKTFSIKFKTDAHPNLFMNPDWFIALIEPHSFGSYTGSARVADGYGIAFFKTRENIEEGTTAQITLELRPPRQKSLSASLPVIAKKLDEDSNSDKEGKKSTPNIQVHPISDLDAYYKENNWTPATVSEVSTSVDSVDIYINDSNINLAKLVERAQQYGTLAVDSIKNRYREHIAFCSFMMDRNSKVHTIPASGHEITGEAIEYLKSAYLENASETVCGMISDFFEFIKTETKEE